MSCCCAVDGTNRFFNTQAGRTEKYFRKKGLHREQKYLVAGLQQHGLQQARLLEIGCGVGGLHLSLLKAGAERAAGIDISEGMIQAAQRLAQEMGLAERTAYQQGDFVALHRDAPEAEITILDKVICCYQNFEELIQRSTAKTKQAYAVCYPRPNWQAHFVFRAGAALLKLLRLSFHPFYHPPDKIQAAIRAQGFEKIFERTTMIWVVQVFQRVRSATPLSAASTP